MSPLHNQREQRDIHGFGGLIPPQKNQTEQRDNQSQLNQTGGSDLNNFADNVIGFFVSNGKANGKPLYRGPRNGIFYINDSNNVSYLTKLQKLHQIRHL